MPWTHQLPGYSLMEVCFGLIILGLVTATVIPLAQKVQLQQKHQTTKNQLEKIALALQKNASQNLRSHRVLCPAQPHKIGSAHWGVAENSCTTAQELVGIIPFRSLGLLEREAKDGYGNFISYAIAKSPTSTDEQNAAFHDQKFAPHSGASPHPVGSSAASLQLHEGPLTHPVGQDYRIKGLLISHGPKGIGAFNPRPDHRARKPAQNMARFTPEKIENMTDSPDFYLNPENKRGVFDDVVHIVC